MIELSRYVFETLREDEEFVLERGQRDGDLSGILVVAPVSEHPVPGILERLEHEYALRNELDSDWAARPLALARREGRTILILEDPGGEPLDRLLGEPMEVSRFLRFAVGLTAALGKLHQRGLIHRDIKPPNILVNFATGAIRLSGFGLSSRLAREHQEPKPPEIIAGTLAYMAPEQTGRMNRSIDSRSDLYSLGVTFYELLTGALPFKASDPMEWVHCHIARQPVPPDQYEKEIPAPLSAIVMKLLAKTAEDRYQTCTGLTIDLQRCLAEWEATGRIEPFLLGSKDASDRLLIPEQHGTVVKASQAMSSEIVLGKLIEILMVIAIEHAGADRGLLILLRGEEPQIQAEAATGCDRVEVMLREEAVTPSKLPESVLHYVIRTRESVILDDAAVPTLFSTDEYVQQRRPRSMLCLPLLKQADLVGVLYLENNLTPRVFTPKRLAMLEMLASQVAISLDHARVYTELARLNRTLQTLYQCNQALVRATEEYELLQSVCRILVEVGGLRMAWVGYRERNAEKAVRPVARAGYEDGYLGQISITWADSETGRGPTGTAIRTGTNCWTRDNRTEPNLAPWRAEDLRRGYASSIALPLLSHGEAFGALTLHAEEPDAFNESTIEQYTDLANNLAYGVTAIRTREESKRAEEALRESEQRLQDIVDNTTAVVFVKDLELRYILVNREYERRHHVQRDQIRGKTDFDIHPHDIAEAVRANDRRVIEAGEPIEFEETVPSADGDRCLIVAKFLLRDRTGKPYAVCGVATDITDRKRAENEIRQLNVSLEKRVTERTFELARSEEKFRALFEGTSQAVVLHDENGILEVNPSWLRFLGYSSLDEVVGKHPAELSAPIQPGGECAEVLARMHIANTLANGSERFDWMMSRRDGTELSMEVFLTRIQLGGRQLIQAVCNDITQRKQAEAELVRTLAREKELGQLRSKFVSMVSHEFRTPLGIIQSSAEILKDYLEQLEPSEREDHLQSICHNTRRMAGIMEEVLLIGSFDAGKMEFKPGALELRTFVRGLVDEVLSATGRRCPIELSLSEMPVEFPADGRLLRHIFTNLLTNAVKYSDAGRAVRFEIGRVGAEIVCAIRDQGIGIPEADREWLFNAFHRGHNVDDRPGTGLGLVIVKRCVDLHGGKINVESKVGEGTVVTVRLPMSSKVSPPASASAGAYWV